ncbi:hypothetical protein O6H91_12G019600 [Diphasiastrum complanatum]|uniref:Uncharacterized protein n=1 Tax=Diphasiastrum complanatum TaxID=34168 RepID=A0ACC2BZC2_DIPCM|nr:hypothetical protein O6H91_12G019600 [Diphasiastrum complanatum]
MSRHQIDHSSSADFEVQLKCKQPHTARSTYCAHCRSKSNGTPGGIATMASPSCLNFSVGRDRPPSLSFSPVISASCFCSRDLLILSGLRICISLPQQSLANRFSFQQIRHPPDFTVAIGYHMTSSN